MIRWRNRAAVGLPDESGQYLVIAIREGRDQPEYLIMGPLYKWSIELMKRWGGHPREKLGECSILRWAKLPGVAGFENRPDWVYAYGMEWNKPEKEPPEKGKEVLTVVAGGYRIQTAMADPDTGKVIFDKSHQDGDEEVLAWTALPPIGDLPEVRCQGCVYHTGKNCCSKQHIMRPWCCKDFREVQT